MFDSLQPHGLQHARLPCPLLCHRVCPDSCPLSRWCHQLPKKKASLVGWASLEWWIMDSGTQFQGLYIVFLYWQFISQLSNVVDINLVFPGGSDGKMLAICLQCRRPGFHPWVWRIPWRREWKLTPVFMPGEFHGQRSLVATIHRLQSWTQLSNQHLLKSCRDIVLKCAVMPLFKWPSIVWGYKWHGLGDPRLRS